MPSHVVLHMQFGLIVVVGVAVGEGVMTWDWTKEMERMRKQVAKKREMIFIIICIFALIFFFPLKSIIVSRQHFLIDKKRTMYETFQIIEIYSLVFLENN